MKQFCPKCCKWYDIYKSVCPECDVLMYTESECQEVIEDGRDLKIVSVKLIDSLNNWGWFILIVGIIGTFLSIGFSTKADTIFGTWITPIICVLVLITGIVFIRKSNKYCKGKKFKEPPDNPYTQCPYCNSKKVVKLTAMDRASSIVAAGVASGKIGKQWHCNNCDSDF